MKKIPLTQGRVAMVDDEDFDRANQFKWRLGKGRRCLYARRTLPLEGGVRGTQYLHQFILGVKKVDHRDGNGLNDQRYNLRPATHQQNMHGPRRKMAGASSVYRGVSWAQHKRLWKAGIRHNRKSFNLGFFKDEEVAAKAYDTAARKLFGEFADLNL